ncbi:hypothetical protein KY363_01150, partial [Candidatus Woesearchaeota archaeon]|nr:hypothetical protein [Candidatus Woesearchaeota archaeon]
DKVVIHRSRLDSSDFISLAGHAVSFRTDSSSRYEHQFYDKYVAFQLAALEQQLGRLADQRYTFTGVKKVLTQHGVLIGHNKEERDYTAIVSLENLLDPSSTDEHFRFELITNGHQHISGDVLMDAGLQEYLVEDVFSVHDGSRIEPSHPICLKVMKAVVDILKVPIFHPIKSTQKTNKRKGERKSVYVIDLRDEMNSTLPFRYSTFSRDDVESPHYRSILNERLAKFTDLCKEVDENPIYVVFAVDASRKEFQGIPWSLVREVGRTESVDTLDSHIRCALNEGERALVTYEQGYISRALKGKGPGTSPVPHFRRLRKRIDDDSYVITHTFVGRTTEEGRRIYDEFERLRIVREQNRGDFGSFLDTPEGKEYQAGCAQLSGIACSAKMNQDDIQYMLMSLGIHFKTGFFAPGFESSTGEKNIQVYRNQLHMPAFQIEK